jgi:tRNA ligase
MEDALSTTSAINHPDPELETCRVVLERIVWDSRVMAIVTRLLDAQEKGLGTTNEIAHITVGTADQTIKPKESNDLLHTWLSGGSEEATGISELEIKGNIVIDGSVRGVCTTV